MANTAVAERPAGRMTETGQTTRPRQIARISRIARKPLLELYLRGRESIHDWPPTRERISNMQHPRTNPARQDLAFPESGYVSLGIVKK